MPKREVRVKGTKEYTAWKNMKSRCNNPKNIRFINYGGRGISVDPAFESFDEFIKCIGHAPIGTTLDRIDVNGNYAPGNVRWATVRTQLRNRTDNRWLEFQGKMMVLADWAKEIGLSTIALWYRIKRGWSVEKALTEPKPTPYKDRPRCNCGKHTARRSETDKLRCRPSRQ